MRLLEVLCHFHICAQTTGWRSGGIKQIAWVSCLFNGLSDKNGLVAHLAPSTDEEIEERISASTNSYTTESNEDTFKPEAMHDTDLSHTLHLYCHFTTLVS